MCGRDGDGDDGAPPRDGAERVVARARAGPRSVARAETGTWTAAGAGAGEYSYPAQCIFYYSENDDCCATKKGWTTANPHVAGASSTHCTDRFGAMSDHWNTKHRMREGSAHAGERPPAETPAADQGDRAAHPLVHGHVVDGLRLQLRRGHGRSAPPPRRLAVRAVVHSTPPRRLEERRPPPQPRPRHAARLGRRDHDQRDGDGGGRAHRRDGRLHDPARGAAEGDRRASARSRASTPSARRRRCSAPRSPPSRRPRAAANYPPPPPARAAVHLLAATHAPAPPPRRVRDHASATVDAAAAPWTLGPSQ